MKTLKTQTLKMALCLGTIFLASHTLHAAGPGEGGGGDGTAAHYQEVVKRAIRALNTACSSADSRADQKLCDLSLNPLLKSVALMEVLPRDKVVGEDGEPRDAGNDGKQKIFLDINKWDERNRSSNPKDREKQVLLALHEPAVLAGLESNDQYNVSSSHLDFLKRSLFSMDAIVGVHSNQKPAEPKLEYKIFKGVNTVFRACDFVSWDGARANAEENAQSENFSNCSNDKVWAIDDVFNKHDCYATVKCSRTVQNPNTKKQGANQSQQSQSSDGVDGTANTQ